MPTQTSVRPGRTLKRLSGWRRAATQPGALDDCALIVPTYRRPREMVRLLDTLAGLPDFPGEVLVVGGSPDLEVEQTILAWAAKRSLPFELVWVKSPAGLTRQRNVGIDACSREFIFFLDDDCLPEPGYFRLIRQVFLGDTAGAVGV